MSLNRLGVAALTIGKRKRHAGVAGAAIFIVEYLDHRILCTPLFYAEEQVRMTEFTPVPYRMFLV